MFKIRLFHYATARGALSGIANAKNQEQAKKKLATDIAGDVNELIKSNSGKDYEILHRDFDSIAGSHTDVWLEKSAYHARLYVDQIQPNIPVPASARNSKQISHKRGFSGSMTGVIAEAAFSWIMRREYQMDSHHIIHLRPTKSTGRYPDFEIHIASDVFWTELLEQVESPDILLSENFPYERLENDNSLGQKTRQFPPRLPIPMSIDTQSKLFPIPCEVKAVTHPTEANIREQLEKAIPQLLSYWVHQGRKYDMGIVSLALRNAKEKTYDIVFVWCF